MLACHMPLLYNLPVWAFVNCLNYKKGQVLAVYFLTVYFLDVSENETKFATKTQKYIYKYRWREIKAIKR